jgi:uncharacterized membrane protein required for colicin V production
MGLDIALGVIVLMAAVRGWLRGFLLQAIPLAALVGCVYAADPLRDLARPSAHEYFPGIRPELLDRLLWWSAAVLTFFVTSGVASAFVRLYRKRPAAEFETRYTDQGAGFLLGAAKGGLVAAFLTAGIVDHVPTYVKSDGWLRRQVETSRAVTLNARYRPASQVWASPPVQTLVARVRSRGLWSGPGSGSGSGGEAKPERAAVAEESTPAPVVAEPVKAAMRTPTLRAAPASPPRPRLDPDAADFLDRFDAALRRELPPAPADRR